MKKSNLRHAVIYLDYAWKAISERNILCSWSALWPTLAMEWDEDDIALGELQSQLVN